MKSKFLIPRFLIIIIFASISQLAFRFPDTPLVNDASDQGLNEAFFDKPICFPDLYLFEPGNCLPLGASETISEMNGNGISYPIKELPAAKPDIVLSRLPALIAKINLDEYLPAPLYASFEDAITQSNPVRYLEPGHLRYVSYFNRLDYKGKPYLQLISSEWVRAAPIAYTKFQGLVFAENPVNDFGWIVDQTQGYSLPSFSAAQTGNYYYHEDTIQIFDSIEAEGVTWYLINPGEWVNSLKARKANFDPTPPDGINISRWISIDLKEQILYVYEDSQLKFSTLIASGLEPFFTQPGAFQIYSKLPLETMTGAFEVDRSDLYYLEDVPWTMYFDEARALHGSYWRTYFGYPQSHGCVNLSPGDANWLFQWAEEGDWVFVFDPSGYTPTDPDFYGPGAP